PCDRGSRVAYEKPAAVLSPRRARVRRRFRRLSPDVSVPRSRPLASGPRSRSGARTLATRPFRLGKRLGLVLLFRGLVQDVDGLAAWRPRGNRDFRSRVLAPPSLGDRERCVHCRLLARHRGMGPEGGSISLAG